MADLWKQSGEGKDQITAKLTNMNGFSDHAIARSKVYPLPVQWLLFDAVRDGKYVNVEWKTASEKNSDFFTVERSADADKFEFVTNYPSAGNSFVLRNYNITDFSPYSAKSYYRLKQTDFDGKYTYSKTIAVEAEQKSIESGNIQINKYDNLIQISIQDLNNSNYYVEIVDMLGRTLYNEQVNSSTKRFLIDIENEKLPSGIYNVTVFNENSIKTKRIVVE